MSRNCGARLLSFSPGFVAVGIKRAPGRNKDRCRSQSRFSPAGPEIVEYDALMMASIETTSLGLVMLPDYSPMSSKLHGAAV